MASNLLTTKELFGKRAVRVKTTRKGVEKTRRVGKVRRFVFHPSEKRLIGIMVKRPDLLLMFHRKDRFVRIGGFEIVDGRVVISSEPEMLDAKACEALGVDWDQCVMWEGMPVLTMSGEELGFVGAVTFDVKTGAVESVQADAGVANDAVVGKRTIPGSMVCGFRRGQGIALSSMGEYGAPESEDDVPHGAILVSDEAEDIETSGGIAESAGKATAKVSYKAKETAEKAKPKIHEAAEKTEEAVNKGAYATGRQLSRAQGMFSEFKENYEKAKDGDDDDDASIEGSGVAEEPSSPAGASRKGSSAASGTPVDASAAGASTKGSGKTTADSNTSDDDEDEGGDEGISADEVTQAIGRQLGKAQGMFSAFKENYDKARRGDDD